MAEGEGIEQIPGLPNPTTTDWNKAFELLLGIPGIAASIKPELPSLPTIQAVQTAVGAGVNTGVQGVTAGVTNPIATAIQNVVTAVNNAEAQGMASIANAETQGVAGLKSGIIWVALIIILLIGILGLVLPEGQSSSGSAQPIIIPEIPAE